LEDLLNALRAEVQRCRGAHAALPWVVIDSYEQTARQIAVAREAGAKVLVIDDVGRLAANAHLLVNPNLDAHASWYPGANGTPLLLGASYALLRKEFLIEDRLRERSRPIMRLLVTLGGSDRQNRLVTVLKGLGELPLRWRAQLKIAVVLGPGYRHVADIQELLRGVGDHVRVHTAVARMGELMACADLAIAGAGSTVYELAHLGVPTVMLTLADNQTRNAEAFSRHGLAVALGPAEPLEPSTVAQAVASLLDRPQQRAAMSARARASVDGLGGERVYQAMTT
jgi:spore coat polysaccharide biosynthesis predicted glycosyltransferase SpsG